MGFKKKGVDMTYTVGTTHTEGWDDEGLNYADLTSDQGVIFI